MIKIFLLSVITFTFFNVTSAQSNEGTLTFQAGFPQAIYKKTYPVISTGLLFSVLHPLKTKAPVSIGGEIGILEVSGSDKFYTGVYDNEYNSFLVASWNHIVTLAALLKLELLNTKSLNVYVDGTIGSNMFLTATTISRDLYIGPITHLIKNKYYYSDRHASYTLRAGAGLGIEIPFGKQKKIAALLKGSWLYGSTAKYYAHPEINNTQIILFPRTSETTMLLAETGIRFSIFNKKRHNNVLYEP